MIKGRRRPARRGVALRAGLRILSLHVIRVQGSLIVALVTGPAIRGKIRILSVAMTRGAVQVHMCASEWELSVVVIEVAGLPVARGVTLEAVVRETGGGMIRIVGVVIVLLMTRPAVSRSAAELAVNVAFGAIDGNVRAGQREVGVVVIK